MIYLMVLPCPGVRDTTSTSCCHVAKFVIRSMSWSSWPIAALKATQCNNFHTVCLNIQKLGNL